MHYYKLLLYKLKLVLQYVVSMLRFAYKILL